MQFSFQFDSFICTESNTCVSLGAIEPITHQTLNPYKDPVASQTKQLVVVLALKIVLYHVNRVF